MLTQLLPTKDNINHIIRMRPLKNYIRWYCDCIGTIEDLKQITAMIILQTIFDTNNLFYMRQKINGLVCNKIVNESRRWKKHKRIPIYDDDKFIYLHDEGDPFFIVPERFRELVRDYFYMHKRHEGLRTSNIKEMLIKNGYGPNFGRGNSGLAKYTRDVKKVLEELKKKYE